MKSRCTSDALPRLSRDHVNACRADLLAGHAHRRASVIDASFASAAGANTHDLPHDRAHRTRANLRTGDGSPPGSEDVPRSADSTRLEHIVLHDRRGPLKAMTTEATTMSSLTKESLTELLASHPPPCLSLYQLTHRWHPENQQDPIRFRNLVKALNASLLQVYPRAEARLLLKPIDALAHHPDFWHQTLEGLARGAGRVRPFSSVPPAASCHRTGDRGGQLSRQAVVAVPPVGRPL